jgi:Spy/CpxP family protein refolding chaperone
MTSTMSSPLKKLATLSAAFAAFAAVGSAGTLGAAVLGVAPAAFAQDQPAAPPAGAQQRGKRMGEILLSLGLNDTQKSKIKEIMASARKQNEGVTDRSVRRENMKKAYAQVKTVLTPAQAKAFDDKMAAMRKEYQQSQAGGSH